MRWDEMGRDGKEEVVSLNMIVVKLSSCPRLIISVAASEATRASICRSVPECTRCVPGLIMTRAESNMLAVV